jgi:parallel beta-helix repeat protein
MRGKLITALCVLFCATQVLPRAFAQDVRYANQYQGEDACRRIGAAVADLPPGGGTVDARAIQGSQRCSVDPFHGATFPVRLLLGKVRITIAAPWEPTRGSSIIGEGNGASLLVFSGTKELPEGILIGPEAGNVELAGLDITGEGNNVVRAIEINGNSDANASIHDNHIFGVAKSHTHEQAGILIVNSSGVSIENNRFNDIGLGTPGGTYDVQVSASVLALGGANKRILVRHNRFEGNRTAQTISLFDASDSEVLDNWIDQNDVIYTTPTSTGYGIIFYSTVGSPNVCRHNRVEGNYVTNTAGTGIYLQSSPDSVVEHNVLHEVAQQEIDTMLTVGGITAIGGGIGGVVPMASGIKILDNTVDGSASNGIELANTEGAVVSANVIKNVQKYAIHLRGNNAQTSVTGNTVLGASMCIGSVNGNASSVTISDNVMSACGGGGAFAKGGIFFSVLVKSNKIDARGGGANGIDYRGQAGTIQDNEVTGAAANGISIGAASDTVVEGNTVTGSRGYAIHAQGTGFSNTVRNNVVRGNGAGDVLRQQ